MGVFLYKGKVADPTIDLGVMTHNIIDKDAIFFAIYQDMLENEKYQIGEM